MKTATHPLDLVPAAQRAPIAAALASAFDSRPLQTLDLIQGGLSSALVYRAVVEGRPYLVRAVTQVDGFNDPARHFTCLRSAADAGLAPPLLFADPATAVSISDFVTAQPYAALQRPRPALLADLADALRRLQATAPFPPLVDYLTGIDGFVAELNAWDGLPAAARPVFDRYAAVGQAYPRIPEDQVSSHNDLNPGNLMWDGARLWIVDWESAFRNDRYADPAQVCNTYAATPEQETDFLTAWLGAPPTALQRARLTLMRQASRMFYAVMFLRLARGIEPTLDLRGAVLNPRPPGLTAAVLASQQGRIDYALGLLHEIDVATQEPAFEASLKIVR